MPDDPDVSRFLAGDPPTDDVLRGWSAQRPALASLALALHPRPDVPEPAWSPPPRWGVLGRLLAAEAGGPLTPGPVDELLQLVAADAAEPLVYDALHERLPAGFVAQSYEAIGRWLIARGARRADFAEGLTLWRVRALAALERYEEAFWLLNRIITETSDEPLRRLRAQLTERFAVQLNERPAFEEGGGYDRVFTVRLPAAGAFGQVLPVRRRSDGERCALKHALLREWTPDEMRQVLDLFAREADLLRPVNHPNVVRLVDVLAPGRVVLEWVNGRALDPTACGIGRPLDPDHDPEDGDAPVWTVEHVLDLGRRVASAMREVSRVHGPGFLHGDLHMGNVMADPFSFPSEGWVKVIDFGLSRSPLYESLNKLLNDIGGYKTMKDNQLVAQEQRPPEVAEGRLVAPGTDVYSLGLILFRLLTNRWPAARDRDAAGARLDEVFRSAPEPVARLVVRMLAPSPADRPGSWDEVVSGLEGVTG